MLEPLAAYLRQQPALPNCDWHQDAWAGLARLHGKDAQRPEVCLPGVPQRPVAKLDLWSIPWGLRESQFGFTETPEFSA